MWILFSRFGVNISLRNTYKLCSYFQRNHFPIPSALSPGSLVSKQKTLYNKPAQFVRSKTHAKLPFEIDTNVNKDVVLFKFHNERFIRILSVFGLAQCVFWIYLAHFAFTSLRDTSDSTLREDEKPWWRKINLGENKYRNGMTILFASIGYVILAGTWMFTLRSVRRLILSKGGESMKVITYAPFAKHRIIEVPLEKMSCSHSRSSTISYLPIKIQGYWFYFLLDKRGTFTNAQLFDYTAGIKRKWR